MCLDEVMKGGVELDGSREVGFERRRVIPSSVVRPPPLDRVPSAPGLR